MDAGDLVGNGEGVAYEEAFLVTTFSVSGFDGSIREVIFWGEPGYVIRLGVVKQEFDFKCAFHGGGSFEVVRLAGRYQRGAVVRHDYRRILEGRGLALIS